MTGRDPNAKENEVTMILHNDREAIKRAEIAFTEAVGAYAYPEAATFALRLAFEESVINAFRHGHATLPDEPVQISWVAGPDEVRLTVEDKGPGFDPEAIPDPTLEENIEKPSGRGLMLIRAYMSRVEFNEKGNRVTLTYQRPPAS